MPLLATITARCSAGLALGMLLIGGLFEPRAARGEVVVFEDHELGDWQFLVPPGDPEIDIEHSPSGASFLTVRHHHSAPLNSLKRSIQGSPQAQYAPGASGAVESFAFAGRFRAHYEGVGPVELYLTRHLGVQAVVRQGGRSFVVARELFAWTNADAALDQWVAVVSGPLLATDFLRDGLESLHPDFSPTGEPMTLALRVSSFYQTSYEEIEPDSTFAIDIDDVRVTAETPTPGDLPRLSFSTAAGLVQMSCGALAVASGHYEGSSATTDLYVRLSQAASSNVSFEMLRDGAAFVPPRGGTGIASGQRASRVSVDLPPGHRAQVYGLASSSGATVAEPSRVALLSHAVPDCAFVVLAHWRSDLRAQGCDPVGGESGLSRSSADAALEVPELSGVIELQAVRDQVMAATPAGRYYAELYKTLSPAIVRTLLVHPALLVDLLLSQDAWIDALATLTEGGADSAQVSAGMAADLNRLLEGFETHGSPALRRTIAHERARLGLSTISGLTVNQFWQRVNDRWDPEPCVAGDSGLCIGGGGGRYRVEADWKTPAGTAGRAHAVALSGDSGYFWFFDPANVELLTKVVDGCGLNQRTWSYSAGLTNLEVDLFVFDTATGRGKSYRNPQATSFAPVLDSDYLECAGEGAATAEVAAISPSTAPEFLALGGSGCVAGPNTLCLDDGRFRVEADWRTAAGASGAARAVPLTDDTGTFWFFHPANIELVVKTIDACGLVGFENYWVFAGGTTDVEVTMRVTDTLRDVMKTYRRPLGVPFAPILDSAAFATCP